MQRLARLSALPIALALLSAEPCRAQFPVGEGSYAQLLAQYDTNGNGLFDDRERASLLSPAEIRQPLAAPALPLICNGLSAGSGGGSSASTQRQPSSRPQVGRHLLWRQQQFAERQPQGNPHFDRAEGALLTEVARQSVDGYPTATSPQPPEPQRQNMQVRNVVLYRMLLNESRRQAGSRPFARAATFGPMLGRTKRYRSAAVDDHCVSSRASLYRLTRY